jgi:glycosyltransferase involved in cell wall biosynthesis
MLQAMATGVVMVASNSAPVRDVVFHQETGYLVDPYDIKAFVAQIQAVLDAPDRNQPLRDHARQLMIEQYSYQVCLPKLAEFYLS